MARQQGVSSAAVQRIWKAYHLQPHRVEHFKFSSDPEFVSKVRDIIGLYLNPPDQALVFSLDEKSQIRALDRTQPILPLRPGLPERQTRDYERHGAWSGKEVRIGGSGSTVGQAVIFTALAILAFTRLARITEHVRPVQLASGSSTSAPTS